MARTDVSLNRPAPLLDSVSVRTDPLALAARLDEHGYLFFRGLLPRTTVLDVRRRILQVLDRLGWLAAGTDPMDGAAAADAGARVAAMPRSCGPMVGTAAYRAIYHLEAFHRLAHHPALLELYSTLFGASVLPHPRNIARVVVPTDQPEPTPPHQDYIHIQGSTNTMTAWLPLGDCPMDLGGLAVLAGSHRDGLLSYRKASGPGGLEAYLCETDYPWVTGDYAAGDVLTFTSQTVHRALPHRRPDRLRLSADFRYQPADDPINDRSLLPHCDVDTWDNIYTGWTDESLQYYWQRRSVQLRPWNERIRWQHDKIC